MLAFFSASFSASLDSPLPSEEEVIPGGIPLSRALVYSGKGLVFGLGFGGLSPMGGEKRYLAAWNGTLEYFYTPWISGGGGVWIYGGDVDSHTMILYSRYRIHSHFHWQPFQRLDVYAGPLLWFESTDIEKFGETDDFGEEKWSSVYDDAPEQNGFALGIEGGFGISLPKNFGFFFEATFEKSFSEDLLCALSIGLAYDLWHLSEFLKENLQAMWLSFEVTSRRYLYGEWERTGYYFLLGLGVSL